MWNIIGQSGRTNYIFGNRRETPQFLQEEATKYIESQLGIINSRFEPREPKPWTSYTSSFVPEPVQPTTKEPQVSVHSSSEIDFQYDINDFRAGVPDTQRFYLPQSDALSASTLKQIYRISDKQAGKALERGYVDKTFSDPEKGMPDMEWNRENINWLKDSVLAAYKNAARKKEYVAFACDPEVSQTVMQGALTYMLNRSGNRDFVHGLRDNRVFMDKQAFQYIGRRLSILERARAFNGEQSRTDATSTTRPQD
jgi:hypothetical protein